MNKDLIKLLESHDQCSLSQWAFKLKLHIPELVEIIKEKQRKNVLKELENWVNGSKGRYVKSINVDTGYGATCWEVVLGNVNIKPKDNWFKEKENTAEVYVAETNFIEYDILPPNVIYVVDGNAMDDWPGLEKTILTAIDKAKELGL